jgi:ribosome-binding protein aMBF1 (putative translation factor)
MSSHVKIGQPRKKSKKAYTPKKRHDRNSVGKTVERIRKQQDLSRDELAAEAQRTGWNISRFIVRGIERGAREVTDIELRKLGKALKVPISALFE